MLECAPLLKFFLVGTGLGFGDELTSPEASLDWDCFPDGLFKIPGSEEGGVEYTKQTFPQPIFHDYYYGHLYSDSKSF